MLNEEKNSLTEHRETAGNDSEVNTFYSSPCFAAAVNREYMGLTMDDKILKIPDESPAYVRHE